MRIILIVLAVLACTKSFAQPRSEAQIDEAVAEVRAALKTVSHHEKSQARVIENLFETFSSQKRLDLLVRALERYIYQSHNRYVKTGVPINTNRTDAAVKGLLRIITADGFTVFTQNDYDQKLLDYYMNERVQNSPMGVDYEGEQTVAMEVAHHHLNNGEASRALSDRKEEIRVAYSYAIKILLRTIRDRTLANPDFYSSLDDKIKARIAKGFLSHLTQWQDERAKDLTAKAIAQVLGMQKDKLTLYLNSNPQSRAGQSVAIAAKKLARNCAQSLGSMNFNGGQDPIGSIVK